CLRAEAARSWHAPKRKRTGDNFAKELAADVAQNGTIKRLVMDRGFGFLSGEDGKEYFFHRSSVEGSFEGLQEGQKVSFDVEASAPKGRRAFLFFVSAWRRG